MNTLFDASATLKYESQVRQYAALHPHAADDQQHEGDYSSDRLESSVSPSSTYSSTTSESTPSPSPSFAGSPSPSPSSPSSSADPFSRASLPLTLNQLKRGELVLKKQLLSQSSSGLPIPKKVYVDRRRERLSWALKMSFLGLAFVACVVGAIVWKEKFDAVSTTPTAESSAMHTLSTVSHHAASVSSSSSAQPFQPSTSAFILFGSSSRRRSPVSLPDAPIASESWLRPDSIQTPSSTNTTGGGSSLVTGRQLLCEDRPDIFDTRIELLSRDQLYHGGVILHLIFLAFLILGWGVLWMNYVNPLARHIGQTYGLHTNKGEATLLAVAGCLPNFIMNIFGSFYTNRDFGTGSALGSGMMNTFVIPAIIYFALPHIGFPVYWWRASRDLVCFSAAVLIMVATTITGQQIDLTECIILLLVFGVYSLVLWKDSVLYVALSQALYQLKKKTLRDERRGKKKSGLQVFLEHRYFANFITACIVTSIIFVIWDSVGDYSFLTNANFAISGIFLLEALLKIFCYGMLGYFADPSNAFDGVLVILIIFELIFGSGAIATSVRAVRLFRFLRALRGLRAVRAVRRAKELKELGNNGTSTGGGEEQFDENGQPIEPDGLDGTDHHALTMASPLADEHTDGTNVEMQPVALLPFPINAAGTEPNLSAGASPAVPERRVKTLADMLKETEAEKQQQKEKEMNGEGVLSAGKPRSPIVPIDAFSLRKVNNLVGGTASVRDSNDLVTGSGSGPAFVHPVTFVNESMKNESRPSLSQSDQPTNPLIIVTDHVESVNRSPASDEDKMLSPVIPIPPSPSLNGRKGPSSGNNSRIGSRLEVNKPSRLGSVDGASKRESSNNSGGASSNVSHALAIERYDAKTDTIVEEVIVIEGNTGATEEELAALELEQELEDLDDDDDDDDDLEEEEDEDDHWEEILVDEVTGKGPKGEVGEPILDANGQPTGLIRVFVKGVEPRRWSALGPKWNEYRVWIGVGMALLMAGMACLIIGITIQATINGEDV